MIHRRELLLVGAGALAAKATASALACASDSPAPKSDDKKKAAAGGAKKPDPTDEKTVEEDAAPDPHAGHAGDGPANTGLAATSSACIQAGNACLSHCLRLLASGDKSMGDCAQRVNDMLAVCEATGRLAANDSSHLKALVQVCHDVCGDCAKACEPHVDHHAECKACKESCDAMMAEAKTFLG